MTKNDQLPPLPGRSDPQKYHPDAETLPPMNDALNSDGMEQNNRLARLIGQLSPSGGMSVGMAVAAIFVGSFIAGVIFTALILAGIIEIQPSAIKGFFKAIMGKS